jgi:hypothetical protein
MVHEERETREGVDSRALQLPVFMEKQEEVDGTTLKPECG